MPKEPIKLKIKQCLSNALLISQQECGLYTLT